MRALAGHLGGSTCAYADTRVLARARATADELGDPGQAARFDRIVDRAADRFGDAELSLGAWHGDWTPWNMVWDDNQVLLWDFERFATDVPLGFDLAHYQLQSSLRDTGETRTGELVTRALPTRGPVNNPLTGSVVVGDNDPEAVLVCYLVELARRYVLASEPVEGTPLRRRTSWLLDLLDVVVVRR
jgi:Phosphotransferase enzyme family